MAKNGITTMYDDNGWPQSAALTAAHTFGSLATIKAGPGRLLKIVVTTVTATAAATVYDNAAAAAGTPLMVIPSGTAAGTVYTVDLPAVNGITVQSTGATGAMTIGYA